MTPYLELERAAAAHWRGTEEEWLGDWLLRAAGGFTGRANSALPLGDPGQPLDAALDVMTRWYRARGLPPMIALPVPLRADAAGRALDAELFRRGWTLRPGPAFVMTATVPVAPPPAGPPPAGLPAGLVFRADPEPDDDWLGAYHYRGQDQPSPVLRALLTSAADQVFLSVRAAAAVAAIARVSFADGWAGIAAVEVSPDRRRAGLGRAVTQEALALAAARGVPRVFLQVEEGNGPALALYERAGFRYSHRYHYRIAPA